MKLPFKTHGFTLFELLVVIAIMGTLSFAFLTTYNSSRQTQSLRVSAEEVADKLREAHVSSREQKESASWGVRKKGENSYETVKEDGGDQVVYSSGVLERGVDFDGDFEIWFELGSGKTDAQHTVRLIDTNGRRVEINVLETGVVEVGSL